MVVCWGDPEFLQLRVFSLMGLTMTKHYRKEIPQMPVYIHGTPLKFEIMETSDSMIIDELDKCIAFGRGGISSISKEEFEEESKKKQIGTISESGYKQKLSRVELSSQQLSPSPVVDGAGISIGGGQFARPQEVGRAHSPREQFGLGTGAGPAANGHRMPDPIEIPKTADMKPPTAKLSELNTV